MSDHDLIGSGEAASILGVDKTTVIRWANKNRLTPVVRAPGPYGAFLFSRQQVVQIAQRRLQQKTGLRRPAAGAA